jgi:hypothetical protein
MLNSICPSSDDLRYHAISILLANDPNLLKFLFSSPLPNLRMRAGSEQLLFESGAFSSGQKLLLKIALDIWCSEGGAQLDDIIYLLDAARFESFMLAMECLRYTDQP